MGISDLFFKPDIDKMTTEEDVSGLLRAWSYKNGQDFRITRKAIAAFGEIGNKRAVGILTELFKIYCLAGIDSFSRVRYCREIESAILNLEDENAIELLLAVPDIGHFRKRGNYQEARKRLLEIQKKVGTEPFINVLRRKANFNDVIEFWSHNKIGKWKNAPYEPYVWGGYWESVKRNAVWIIGEIGGEKAAQLLTKIVTTKDADLVEDLDVFVRFETGEEFYEDKNFGLDIPELRDDLKREAQEAISKTKHSKYFKKHKAKILEALISNVFEGGNERALEEAADETAIVPLLLAMGVFYVKSWSDNSNKSDQFRSALFKDVSPSLLNPNHLCTLHDSKPIIESISRIVQKTGRSGAKYLIEALKCECPEVRNASKKALLYVVDDVRGPTCSSDIREEVMDYLSWVLKKNKELNSDFTDAHLNFKNKIEGKY